MYYINIELIPIFFYQKLYIKSSITVYKYPFTYTPYHMNRFQNIVIIFSYATSPQLCSPSDRGGLKLYSHVQNT